MSLPPNNTKNEFLAALAALAAENGVELITDATRLDAEYSSDKSAHTKSIPLAAVLPTTPELVAAVVKLCDKFDVPITPRGAGTGLEGGCIPYGRGLVIDTSKLLDITIDKNNNCAWVGAGVKKLQLNKHLSQFGFVFGPDPASNPSVGGMVSTSGSGMSTVKYGTTRENIVSLKVVTASGELIQTRRVVRKSSTGLDLTNLYCGSEGTLGVICAVCVKLNPLLTHISGGFGAFETTSQAVAAVVDVRRLRLSTLVRCELLNTGGVVAANKEYGTTLAPHPTILIELQDAEPIDAAMRSQFERIAAVFAKHGATSVTFLSDREQLDAIWEARRGCLWAAAKYRGGAKKKKADKVLNTDVCVPMEHLAQCVSETEADFESLGVPCVICAHVADGNFHTMIPHETEVERKAAEELETRMCQRALRFGGTVSGEHGVGIGKVKHLISEHGAAHIAVQRRIKEALDPKGLFNRGCFYPHEQQKHGTAHL